MSDTYNAGLPNCQFGINPGVHWSNCPHPDRCQIHGPLMRQEQGAPGYGGTTRAAGTSGDKLNLVIGLVSLAAVVAGVVTMLIVVSRPSNWFADLVDGTPLAPAEGAGVGSIATRSVLLFALSGIPFYAAAAVAFGYRRARRDEAGAGLWGALSLLTTTALLAVIGWAVVCVGVIVGLADGREPYGPDTEPTAITPIVLALLVGSIVWLSALSANRRRHRLAAVPDVEGDAA